MIESKKMRSRFLVGTVVAVHCIALGSFVLLNGCGTTGRMGRGGSEAPPPIMPPTETTEVVVQGPMGPRNGADNPAWPNTTSAYVVAKGDCLSAIATRFGVRMGDVVRLNGLTNPNSIRIGQKLLLPGKHNIAKPAPQRQPPKPLPPGGKRYRVERGDTLSGIAVKFGVKTADLRKANNMTSDTVYAGREIIISGGGSPAPVAGDLGTGMNLDETPIRAGAQQQPPVVEKQPAPANNSGAKKTTYITYKVEAGDTVKKVAMMWGVSEKEVRQINGLSGDKLMPNMRLKIPISQ